MASNNAVVINDYSRSFFSNNDYAFVTKDEEFIFNAIKYNTTSLVLPKDVILDESISFRLIDNSIYYGLVPYTIDIHNDISIDKEFPSVTSIINDHTVYSTDINKGETVFVTQLQPTNIYYKPISTIVYGDLLEDQKVPLSGATVNVHSKFEVIIPEFSTYGNITLTVQKNCFIELNLPDNVIDVLRLPDELVYEHGYIKGIFTKSGMYSIIIEYADGNQIIHITVPYYKRIL